MHKARQIRPIAGLAGRVSGGNGALRARSIWQPPGDLETGSDGILPLSLSAATRRRHHPATRHSDDLARTGALDTFSKCSQERSHFWRRAWGELYEIKFGAMLPTAVSMDTVHELSKALGAGRTVRKDALVVDWLSTRRLTRPSSGMARVVD
jgi:hypothetical protein